MLGISKLDPKKKKKKPWFQCDKKLTNVVVFLNKKMWENAEKTFFFS